MTIEDALKAIAIAEAQITTDGVTPGTIARLRYLTTVLVERPADFWEEYFDIADPSRIIEGMKLLEQLGPNATHGDMRFLVELEAKRIASLAE